MNKDDTTVPDDIHALVAQAVLCLLKSDNAIAVNVLIDKIYHISLCTEDLKTRLACQRAIAILARKMH